MAGDGSTGSPSSSVRWTGPCSIERLSPRDFQAIVREPMAMAPAGGLARLPPGKEAARTHVVANGPVVMVVGIRWDTRSLGEGPALEIRRGDAQIPFPPWAHKQHILESKRFLAFGALGSAETQGKARRQDGPSPRSLLAFPSLTFPSMAEATSEPASHSPASRDIHHTACASSASSPLKSAVDTGRTA